MISGIFVGTSFVISLFRWTFKYQQQTWCLSTTEDNNWHSNNKQNYLYKTMAIGTTNRSKTTYCKYCDTSYQPITQNIWRKQSNFSLLHHVTAHQLSGILICDTSEGGLSVQTISLVFPKYTCNVYYLHTK